MNKNYNKININPNKSLQSNKTDGFESPKFIFSNVSATETLRYVSFKKHEFIGKKV